MKNGFSFLASRFFFLRAAQRFAAAPSRSVRALPGALFTLHPFLDAGTLGAVLFLASIAAPAVAQKNAQPQPAQDFEMESRHATSIPLRDMPTVDVAPPYPHREHEPLKRPLPPGMVASAAKVAQPDRVAQIRPRPLGAVPIFQANFLGEGVTLGGLGGDPSDSEGNIGLTQYVEFINTAYAVFDKNTGVLEAGPVAGSTLFSALGGDCASTDDGDPIVQYDKAANRWILSQFSVANAFQTAKTTHKASECVAVSATADATGPYHVYQFQYSNFNDYPKMGVWSDKWLVNYNMFALPTTPISQNPNSQPGAFIGDEMCALDRANMIAGNPVNQACAPPNANEFTLLPSDLDGLTPPPANEHGFFIGLGQTTASLDMFTVSSANFSTGALSLNQSPSNPTVISIPSFGLACDLVNPNDPNGSVCIPQNDGGQQKLDSIGDRLMYRLAYRNFGSYDVVVASHTVDVSGAVNGQTGVRWYEIRNLGGTPNVFQSGTYAPDTSYRWVPSIAMDKMGNIAVGYSVGNSGLDASISVSTRAPNDSLGVLGNEASIQTGTGAQQGSSRWGDYTAMTVDPVDDCTMWYIDQFLGSSGLFSWDTEIASFQMSKAVALNPSPFSLNQQAGVPFSMTVSARDASNNTAGCYTGTVRFFSSDSDPRVVLPSNFTFSLADNGAHTFNGITLIRSGVQTIGAVDTSDATIAGTTGNITVAPGPAATMVVSASSPQTAGAAFTVFVTAEDQFGNIATSYTGKAHFTSSDPKAVLPADSTLSNGQASFQVTLKTAGNQTLTATDTVSSSITGNGNVTVIAAAASQFAFVVPATAKQGLPFNFQLAAKDPFGNVAPSYRGTVTFTSSDGSATKPSPYTFVAGDNGIHVFSATLNTLGGQTLTATDAGHFAKTSGTITVSNNDPALHAISRTIRIFRATPQVIVGSFTDDDTAETNANGTDLTATINWGDGSPADTSATIVYVGGLPNLFNVIGSHTYTTKGPFTVTVTVTDTVTGGSTTIVTSTERFFPRTFSF